MLHERTRSPPITAVRGAMGVLNLFVAYSFSEDIWVKFKVFGTLAISLVLAFVQGWRLMRYAKAESQE